MVTAIPSVRLLPPPSDGRMPEAGAPAAAVSETASAPPVEAAARIAFRPEGGQTNAEAEATRRERPAEAPATVAEPISGTVAPDGFWARLKGLGSGLQALLSLQEAGPESGTPQSPAAVTQAYHQTQAMAWRPRRTVDLVV